MLCMPMWSTSNMAHMCNVLYFSFWRTPARSHAVRSLARDTQENSVPMHRPCGSPFHLPTLDPAASEGRVHAGVPTQQYCVAIRWLYQLSSTVGSGATRWPCLRLGQLSSRRLPSQGPPLQGMPGPLRSLTQYPSLALSGASLGGVLGPLSSPVTCTYTRHYVTM